VLCVQEVICGGCVTERERGTHAFLRQFLSFYISQFPMHQHQKSTSEGMCEGKRKKVNEQGSKCHDPNRSGRSCASMVMNSTVSDGFATHNVGHTFLHGVSFPVIPIWSPM
jgi:hypothetical protein